MNVAVASAEVTGLGGAGERYRLRAARKALACVLGVAVLAASLLLDLGTGPGNFPVGDLLAAFWDPAAAPPKLAVIVWDLRLPIALMAALIGAMLGVAGAEMQTVLHNPLADPFTLGVSAAAGFGASLAIVSGGWLLGGAGPIVVTLHAFVFALGASLLMLALTTLKGAGVQTVILVGISILFTFNALLALMQFAASEQQLQAIVFWTLGSLARASWDKIAIAAGVLALALALIVWRAGQLTLVALGDGRAEALGVDVRRLRIEMLVAVSALAATSVAFIGAVGFIGLVGPHIARMLVGEDQRVFLPLAALASAVLMSLTSTLSKAITPGVIYPIGIITALVGIPFFLALVLTRKAETDA